VKRAAVGFCRDRDRRKKDEHRGWFRQNIGKTEVTTTAEKRSALRSGYTIRREVREY